MYILFLDVLIFLYLQNETPLHLRKITLLNEIKYSTIFHVTSNANNIMNYTYTVLLFQEWEKKLKKKIVEKKLKIIFIETGSNHFNYKMIGSKYPFSTRWFGEVLITPSLFLPCLQVSRWTSTATPSKVLSTLIRRIWLWHVIRICRLRCGVSGPL